MSITTDTRWESFEKLDTKTMRKLIINELHENSNEGLTAREVAIRLYNKGFLMSSERQATAPRLTELMDEGKVVVIGKRMDGISKRNVAVYSLKEENT